MCQFPKREQASSEVSLPIYTLNLISKRTIMTCVQHMLGQVGNECDDNKCVFFRHPHIVQSTTPGNCWNVWALIQAWICIWTPTQLLVQYLKFIHNSEIMALAGYIYIVLDCVVSREVNYRNWTCRGSSDIILLNWVHPNKDVLTKCIP